MLVVQYEDTVVLQLYGSVRTSKPCVRPPSAKPDENLPFPFPIWNSLLKTLRPLSSILFPCLLAYWFSINLRAV
eukprot:SAG25_NODE_11632_length_299_cov_1.335000_1_plen_73_part_01